MKIILFETVESLGEVGEVVEVKDGYARNYLIPKGIAVEASGSNLRELKERKRRKKIEQKKAKQQAVELSKKVKKESCTIPVKAEGDNMFGAVTSMDIVDSFEEKGIHLDKTNILLEQPIKELGIFKVPVKLHPEVTTEIKVWVVKK